jgi:hypothetical protein
MPSAPLREHQHELSDVFGEDGIVFGTEDTGYLTLTRPANEGGEQRVGDRDRPGEDGRMFGTDYQGAKSVVFEIGVLTDRLALDPHRGNLGWLDRLEGAWGHRRWRNSPGAMAMLRSHEAGETWRCYGRPRRYEEVVGPLTQRGFSTVVSSFDMVDSAWYSGLSASSEGGIKAPLKAPLGLSKPAQGTGSLIVGGTRETWPIIEFRGPISNPSVQIGTLSVGLTRTLEANEVIVVDPTPWVRAVYRLNDDAGFAGSLSGTSPAMRDMVLTPGTHQVTLTGVDSTGKGRVSIRWRDSRSRQGGAWPVPKYVPGQPGPSAPILIGDTVWAGYGPPPTEPFGAKPGDEYIDLNTGMVYTLT